MKPTLIRQVKLIEKENPLNGKTVDIRINANGDISEISDHLTYHQEEELIDQEGLCVSRGWTDLNAHFCDPGLEHRETIESGSEAALAGGFCRVALSPLTQPVCDNKSKVEYLGKKRKNLPEILPKGTISEGAKGKNLSEMFDMASSGAVAFYDGKTEISESLLIKALQYTQQINSPVFVQPNTKHFQTSGQVHEGENAVYTGLKTIPALSESLMTQKALSVLKYTGGKLHLHGISTAESVELIHQAKQDNLQVTADVFAHQLAFDDSVTLTFDTNFKVFPPFRSAQDISKLLWGLKEGVIDAVCSDHSPVDIEGKACEFDSAEAGMTGIQTVFPVLNTQAQKNIPLDDLIEKLTTGPEKILGINSIPIQSGNKASLTLFFPDKKWIYKQEDHRSKSLNTPFFGENFIGKAFGVIAQKNIFLSD